MNNSTTHWASLWRDASQQSPFRKTFADESVCWNASAKHYDQTMGGSTPRITAVMDLLSSKGFLTGGLTALDIGSGTGAYTLPLSDFCHHVTAMDISDSMNKILLSKLNAGNRNNVTVLQEDFLNYDFGSQTFDIVLTCLAPGLYNPDALLKMITLCRKICIYIGIDPEPVHNASPRKPSLNELLLGHNLSHNGSNLITYPLNMLQSLGYEPELTNVICAWDHQETITDAVSRLTEHYMSMPNASKTWTPIIEAYINEHSENGFYHHKSSTRLGILSFNCQ